LKRAKPGLAVFAGDLSPQAVLLTRRNAALLGVVLDVRQGDLLAPFEGTAFDLILANPPYIRSGDLAGLQDEVLREPALALDGGEDGLDLYRRIFADAPRFLKPGGLLLLEIGDGQAQAVSALVPGGFSQPDVHADLSGRPRVVTARRVFDGC
jgi:release factor glutamine methyltransferase